MSNIVDETVVGVVLGATDETGSDILKISIPEYMGGEADKIKTTDMKIDTKKIINKKDWNDSVKCKVTNYIEARPFVSLYNGTNSEGSRVYKPRVGDRVHVHIKPDGEYYYSEGVTRSYGEGIDKGNDVLQGHKLSTYAGSLLNNAVGHGAISILSKGKKHAIYTTEDEDKGKVDSNISMITKNVGQHMGYIPESNFHGWGVTTKGASIVFNDYTTVYKIVIGKNSEYLEGFYSDKSKAKSNKGLELNKYMKRLGINYKSIYNKDKDRLVIGKKNEIVNGDVSILNKANRTTQIKGNATENIFGNLVETIKGNETKSISGGFTMSIPGTNISIRGGSIVVNTNGNTVISTSMLIVN